VPVSVYFRDPGYYLEPWLLTPLGTAATHAQMAYNTVHRRCELSSKDALVCWSRGSCASTRLETHCSTQLIKRVSCSSPLLRKTVLAKYFCWKSTLHSRGGGRSLPPPPMDPPLHQTHLQMERRPYCDDVGWSHLWIVAKRCIIGLQLLLETQSRNSVVPCSNTERDLELPKDMGPMFGTFQCITMISFTLSTDWPSCVVNRDWLSQVAVCLVYCIRLRRILLYHCDLVSLLVSYLKCGHLEGGGTGR